MAEKNPAISIVMPMYNMENYIGECLDSVLSQTFQNYEVIIVDDCSTDKSCEIVESYKPKFGGKLQLIKSEKNSGGHVGVPRNKGIEIIKGKYVYFVDSDDALMENSLEKFYNTAEEFQADVVHCNKTFQTSGKIDLTQKDSLDLVTLETGIDITEPILMNTDLKSRLKIFFNGKFRWEPWNHIVRRDFMLRHGIKFPALMSISDDMVFSLTLLLAAESIIIIPEGLYIWRNRETSNSVRKWSVEKEITKVGGDIIHGINFIEKFCTERNIFEDDPALKFSLYNGLMNFQIGRTALLYETTPVNELDEIIYRELERLDDKTAVTAFFFDYINKNYFQARKLAEKLNAVMKENAELVKQTNSLKELGKSLIKQLQSSRVETQNLKSVLNGETAEAFLKFNDGE